MKLVEYHGNDETIQGYINKMNEQLQHEENLKKSIIKDVQKETRVEELKLQRKVLVAADALVTATMSLDTTVPPEIHQSFKDAMLSSTKEMIDAIDARIMFLNAGLQNYFPTDNDGTTH